MRLSSIFGLAAAIAAMCTAMNAPAASAAFPGEPGRIAFGTTLGDNPFCCNGGLYSVNPDGSRLRRLTSYGCGWAQMQFQEPEYTPDGRGIVHIGAMGAGAGRFRTNIFIKSASTANELCDPGRKVLRRHLRDLIQSAAISPGGNRIAFSTIPRGEQDHELFTVGIKGGSRRRLTFNRVQDIDPAFSPRGRRIAWTAVFQAKHDGIACCFGPSDIFSIRVTGRAKRRLTDSRTSERPSYSPSGRKIVFERDFSAAGGERNELFVMDAGGRRERRITRTKTSESAPAFSPDGRQLVFERGCESGGCAGTGFASHSRSEIWALRLGSGGMRRVYASPDRDDYEFTPSWGPVPRPRRG